MRTALAIFLVAIGAIVMLYGIATGLASLVAIYQNALTDPLAEPAKNEMSVRSDILRSVAIGAAGIVPFLIGSVMLKVGLFRVLIRKSSKNS